MTSYRTIVADPPWEYDEGFCYLEQNGARQEALPYPSMSLVQILDLDVAKFRPAAKVGCSLWLWTTNRYLRPSFDIMEHWGFAYKQTLVWHKTNPVPTAGSAAPNAEFLLLGVFGSHKWHGGKWPNAVVSAPASEHSRKPDVFQDLIEQISPGPYLELFARRQRLGWDTWGNEALCHVELETPTRDDPVVEVANGLFQGIGEQTALLAVEPVRRPLAYGELPDDY